MKDKKQNFEFKSGVVLNIKHILSVNNLCKSANNTESF